jgi:hypothetical protein
VRWSSAVRQMAGRAAGSAGRTGVRPTRPWPGRNRHPSLAHALCPCWSGSAAGSRTALQTCGGSKLGRHEICDVSDAGWAWGIATDTGPIRLPGEGTGGFGDPFAEQLDPDVARRLREWAAAHEDDAGKVGDAWRTKEDLWTARFRLGLPWHRSGGWPWFDQAAGAAVDGDLMMLHRALPELI